MFTIQLAGVPIGIDNRFEYVKRVCADYLADGSPAFCVSVSSDDIERERSLHPAGFSDAYLESCCLYRDICLQLPLYGVMLFHASVGAVDGKAYAFSGRSGVGKSTHTGLWKELLGDRLIYINGDKPLIGFVEGVPYVYGSPWAGKEKRQTNTRARLAAICFLAQAENNFIRPLPLPEAVVRAFQQTYLPQERAAGESVMDMLDRLLLAVDLWELRCTPTLDAARLSYGVMAKKAQPP
jgi:hypothetical protein